MEQGGLWEKALQMMGTRSATTRGTEARMVLGHLYARYWYHKVHLHAVVNVFAHSIHFHFL